MSFAVLLLSLGLLLALVGIVGTVVPLLPGPPLVFAGLALAAWADGFSRVGWPTLLVLALLTAVTVAIDLGAASLGTRSLRASPLAAVGAAVGTVVGLFFGIPGLVLLPFAGAVAGEYWARRDLRRAGKVGAAAWLGLLLGGVIKLAIVFVMVGWFLVALFL